MMDFLKPLEILNQKSKFTDSLQLELYLLRKYKTNKLIYLVWRRGFLRLLCTFKDCGFKNLIF